MGIDDNSDKGELKGEHPLVILERQRRIWGVGIRDPSLTLRMKLVTDSS
jgi:hypothetical protein